ncbi:EF-hand domain-containing protein [Nonomuraea pusilla]|uniref:EF-hand domain-containing protein n=1 Tax=Nonomuraea pusilla TaxID=46177 RepID=UPI00331C34C1
MSGTTDAAGGSYPLLRQYCNEARWGLAASRASVLEAAYPPIGGALTGNSTFVARPWRRLRNTITSTQRLVSDDEQVRRREANRLNRLHARISGTDSHGRPYDATDSEARAWVMATLFESTVMMCRLGGRPLGTGEQEQMYAEFRGLLALMGDDPGNLPPTLPEFWDYYDEVIRKRLEDNEAVRAVLHRVFAEVPPPPLLRDHPALWSAIRAVVGPVATAITVASLPESYRRQAGITVTPAAQALMRGAYLAAGVATRVLPPALTQVTSVLGVLDPGDDDAPDPATRALGALLHQAARAGELLRLLTQPQAQPSPWSEASDASDGPGRAEPEARAGSAEGGAGGSARRTAAAFFAEVLDQTGDGYLDWPDLAAMAREIASRLDLDEDMENRLFTAYAAWWQELHSGLDADGDGRITAQEYASAVTTLASPALIRVAEVLFDATDSDDDQSVSAEEHRMLFRTAFGSEPRGDASRGGDGRLSRSAFVREFLAFMSGRRSTAYDRLFTEA